MSKQYWLMKSEPDVFSIDDLAKYSTTWWEGVRNYQARNFMMTSMKTGDEVLFYHSSSDPAGIAGIARVSKPAAADQSQFDPKSEYFEPKATREVPRWYCVQVEFVKKFKKFISLEQIRNDKQLAKMLVIKRGQGLSIQPLTEQEFQHILKLGDAQ